MSFKKTSYPPRAAPAERVGSKTIEAINQKLTAYKSEVIEGLKEGIYEMHQIKSGKIQGIPAKQLLDEL
jgi:hypothetical protein